MFLDFHTHQLAKESGVRNIYNVILNARAIEEQHWKRYDAVSLGIHPWYIDTEGMEETLAFLSQAAVLPSVKCIGEAGLDRLRGADFRLQEEVFIRQVRIAEQVGKPVVVHCVRAFNELMVIKKTLDPCVPLVIHGFSRKPELAAELISKGFYLSFGKDILDKPYVQQALKDAPSDRFFLETDDSTEAGIKEMYEQAARLRGITLNELQAKTEQNYNALVLNNK